MASLANEQIELIASRSRALGDATRVRILSVLRRGEQAVGQIAEAARTQQSTVSKHLQVLFHAGLVQRRRSAATVIYRITSPDVIRWLRYLSKRRIGKRVTRRTGSVQRARSASARRRKHA
jgi:DNA-binding transcriptional ArsR family regulator